MTAPHTSGPGSRPAPVVPIGAGHIGRGRMVLGGLGVALVGAGGVLVLLGAYAPVDLVSGVAWLIGPPLLSDLVIMPITALVGTFVVGRLPARWRTPVTVAAALSGMLVLVGWPFVSGLGAHPDNPSLLDRDYPGGALVGLGVVWAGTLLAGMVPMRRHGRKPARRSASLPKGEIRGEPDGAQGRTAPSAG